MLADCYELDCNSTTFDLVWNTVGLEGVDAHVRLHSVEPLKGRMRGAKSKGL